jgi:hypothetical protein
VRVAKTACRKERVRSEYISFFRSKRKGTGIRIVGPTALAPSTKAMTHPSALWSRPAGHEWALLNEAIASSRRIATTTLGAGRTSLEHTRSFKNSSETQSDQSPNYISPKITKERSQKEILRTEKPNPNPKKRYRYRCTGNPQRRWAAHPQSSRAKPHPRESSAGEPSQPP